MQQIRVVFQILLNIIECLAFRFIILIYGVCQGIIGGFIYVFSIYKGFCKGLACLLGFLLQIQIDIEIPVGVFGVRVV